MRWEKQKIVWRILWSRAKASDGSDGRWEMEVIGDGRSLTDGSTAWVWWKQQWKTTVDACCYRYGQRLLLNWAVVERHCSNGRNQAPERERSCYCQRPLLNWYMNSNPKYLKNMNYIYIHIYIILYIIFLLYMLYIYIYIYVLCIFYIILIYIIYIILYK